MNPSQPHLCFCLNAKVKYYETIKDILLDILSGTHRTVKQ